MAPHAWRRAPVTVLALLSLAAPAGAAAPGPAPLSIHVGQAKDFSRIEFRWAGPAALVTRRDGDTLTLQFSRTAPSADYSLLRVDPPKFLKTAAVSQTSRGLEIRLQLAPGADAKVGAADGATYVNLFPVKPANDQPPPPAPLTVGGPERVDPVPASGVVKVSAQTSGGQLVLRFPWKAPLGAAVFRRGEAVWIVFDAPARLDVSAIKGHPQVRAIQVAPGEGVSALRLSVADGLPVTASAAGAVWTVALGVGTETPLAPVSLARDPQAAQPGLAAAMAGATKVAWVADPVVGDRIAVVTARAPSKGVPVRRDFMEMSALASAQGLAIERAPDDLAITSDGDVVRITRPGGLKLSQSYAMGGRAAAAAAGSDLPGPAALPALINFEAWSRVGAGGFLTRYDELLTLSASETNREASGDKAAGVHARMALARFLVGSELSYEAIGVLNMVGRSHPEMLSNPEFRGLRGAAKVMAGRYKEAQTDFSSPVLTDDPSSSLWRGYAAARLGQWSDARSEFRKGLTVIGQVAPAWRARFARADAQAALGLNDHAAAKAEIALAVSQPQPVEDLLRARLVQAQLFEAEGHPEDALPVYDALARAALDEVAAPATLHATQIRLGVGKMSATQAATIFDSLRFRWRGDAVELSVIRALGQLYLNQGRYREALEALRSAGGRLPDLPEAMQLQADLAAAFKALFLQGQADGLQPVQALGLFYDFKELTPVGAEGDEMVRKLAQRLVNVDLLDQAADLLKYQADNRLDGVPRAMVATDEALIDVMARKPEAALEALNASRTTLLPAALNGQRRVIEARAWLQLNQPDHALEILGPDASPDAQALKADIAWARKDWASAGRLYEVGLGHRFDAAGQPLAPEEEERLLRAAIAYSLAEDQGALARLRGRYQGFVLGARQPDALRVALAGADEATPSSAAFGKVISDDEAFEGWVQRMKQRLRNRDAAPGAPAGVPQLLNTAQAASSTAKG